MSGGVVLHDAAGLRVRARLSDDGGLVIEGQDLRGREYECFLTVPAEDVALVAGVLGGERADVLGALERRGRQIGSHGEKRWLEETGARVRFFSPS